MTITFQRTLEDIVPGRPSWWVVRDGVKCERVWVAAAGGWHSIGVSGCAERHGAWSDALRWLILPADTPEPVAEERGETVEVRIAVIVLVDIHGVHYGAYGDSDYNDATSEGAARICHGVRVGRESLSWVTARVPLPAKPAEVVGEVSDG